MKMNHGGKKTVISIAKQHRCRLSVYRPISTFKRREWSTPLARTIAEAIKMTGPISIATFMRQVLTSPSGGYYTTRGQGSDIFGEKGDFVTSPEISQVFGELIGVWVVAEWMAQGRVSSGVELIEVGPGKGTLMADILRTIRNFKGFVSTIEAIYLVEASPALREIQKRLLCGDAAIQEIEIGYRSESKDVSAPIIWVEDVRLLPYEIDRTPFILAHEFFDALPIYAFQSVAPPPTSQSQVMTPTGPITLNRPARSCSALQWRELMVSLNPKSFVESREDEPEFQLSLARTSTPSSLVIPQISDRYKRLKSQEGSTIEISPESRIYMGEFARRIGGSSASPIAAGNGKPCAQKPFVKKKASGAALILDYGPALTIPVNSLRGIRGHTRISPFSFPGQVDVSADVDFAGLAEAAIEASEGVEVYGPVEQGDFLQSMGIAERANQLMKTTKDDERRLTLEAGWKRLIDKGVGGMGKIYKALAIIPENGGKRRPLGFGGTVEV